MAGCARRCRFSTTNGTLSAGPTIAHVFQVRPTVSVVVPCWNAERWIGSTLRSVQAQAWPKLEIVVVDDGSTDATAAIVARDFPNARLLRQANSGVAAARNLGIRQSHGEWLAFIDADDIWLPGKLEAQFAALRAASEARMAYSAWHVWPSTDAAPNPAWLASQHPEEDVTHWRGPSGWIYADLLLDCHVWTSTVVAQRQLLDEIGEFDTSLRIGEDLDLWLRASRVTPILRVPRPLALYRMHPHNITKAPQQKAWQALVIERALDRWGYCSPDGRSADKSEVDRALAGIWRDFAGAHLSAGNLALARAGARSALRADWRAAANWALLLKTGWQTAARELS